MNGNKFFFTRAFYEIFTDTFSDFFTGTKEDIFFDGFFISKAVFWKKKTNGISIFTFHFQNYPLEEVKCQNQNPLSRNSILAYGWGMRGLVVLELANQPLGGNFGLNLYPRKNDLPMRVILVSIFTGEQIINFSINPLFIVKSLFKSHF